MSNAEVLYDQVTNSGTKAVTLPKGSFAKKPGNVFGKATTFVGGAISKVGDVVNMIPLYFISGTIAAGLNATGSSVKAVGEVLNGNLRTAGNEFVGGHIAAKTRALASFVPLATTVDGFTGASKKLGFGISDKIIGKPVDVDEIEGPGKTPGGGKPNSLA